MGVADDDADAPAAPGALSLEQIYAKIMKNKVSPCVGYVDMQSSPKPCGMKKEKLV